MNRPVTSAIDPAEKDALALSIHRKMRRRIHKHYTAVVDAHFDEIDDLAQVLGEKLAQYKTLCDDFRPGGDSNRNDIARFFNDYNGVIHARIEDSYPKREQPQAFLDTDKLAKNLDQLVEELPATLRHTQQPARFYVQPEDPWDIRLRKPAKRLFFGLSVLPLRIANPVRKIFKRKTVPVEYWPQMVPFQACAAYNYTVLLTKELMHVFDWSVQQYTLLLDDLVKVENAVSENMLYRIQQQEPPGPFDFQSHLERVADCRSRTAKAKDAHRKKTNAILRQQFKLFAKSLEKAGTFELPKSRFTAKRLGKEKRRTYTVFEKRVEQWFNAVFLAYRDWLFDLEIFVLVERIWLEKSHVDQVIRDRISNRVLPAVQAIRASYMDLKNALNPSSKRSVDFRKKLVVEQREVETGAAGQLAQDFVDLDFPGLANSLQAKVNHILNTLSAKCWLVRKEKLLMPVREAEISDFSPIELLRFESLPKLEEELDRYKVALGRRVGSISEEIGALPRIHQFNVETALEVLDGDDQKASEAVKVLDEGFERIFNKLDDLEAMLQEFGKENIGRLEETFRDFNARVLQLTDNENALNVKLRFTKAVALRKTVAYRTRLIYKGRRGVTRIRRYSKVLWRRFLDMIRPLQRKVGFQKEATIAPELSDFLSYSHEVINSLPLVYRKLYSIHPLHSRELFIGRDAELKKIQDALSRWEQGRYASTVVVGEKWSGLTSLINIALAPIAQRYKVIRIVPEGGDQRKGSLMELFSSADVLKGAGTLGELIEHVLQLPGRHVIVIEDLQKLYLRKVHGFATLRALFRLISSTSHRVFWICTCTRYAWNYLDQAVGIASHFGYVIGLGDMKDQAVTDIILRRNSISGYRVHYNPSSKMWKNKKFVTLDQEHQQQYLKEQFFSNLNAFAKSNISLALLYWLLSTQEITEEGIEIGHFEKPDFAFLDRMSIAKIMGLLMLVVHDGLSVDHFSEMMDLEKAQGTLLLDQLTEDGIVVQRNGDFFVNTLLYRPAVNMLKSKNLIY